MALPVTIPNTFANATSSIPLSQLDTNFSTLANAVNGLNSGSETLANLKATTANVGVLTVTGNATIGDASTDTVTLNSTLTANTAVIFAAGTSAAPSITTTGDLNTGIFFPAADTIAFAEGGAEAMRIDSSGNLGLGVTPSAWSAITAFQIKSGSVGSNLSVDRFYILSNAANLSAGWRYINSNYALRYEQAADSGQHQWFTAPSGTAGNAITWTQAMTLDESGNLLVGITSARANAGDVQVSKGISFPATQSASSDANTLDDYEEGTWTPTLGGSGSNPTGVTYNAQQGIYTKIGRQVTITFQLSFSTYTGGSGNVRINGLPFTGITSYIQYGAVAIENVTLSAGRTAAVSAVSGGATFIAIYQYGSNVAYIDIPLANMASSGTVKYLDGEITYFV